MAKFGPDSLCTPSVGLRQRWKFATLELIQNNSRKPTIFDQKSLLLSTYIPDKLSYLSCTARPTLNPIDTEDSNFTKDGNNSLSGGAQHPRSTGPSRTRTSRSSTTSTWRIPSRPTRFSRKGHHSREIKPIPNVYETRGLFFRKIGAFSGI